MGYFSIINRTEMTRLCILLMTCLLVASQCTPSCCDENTVSVAGAGSAEVDPDIVVFTVSVKAQARTSAAALSAVNKALVRANSILADQGLPTNNRTTSGINISPQYNYSNGVSYLVGQQASTSMKVTLGSFQGNPDLIGGIVQLLSAVKGLTISGFNFQNQDTTQAYRQARRAAVQDAKAKARQYASLSAKGLGRVRKVVDQNR